MGHIHQKKILFRSHRSTQPGPLDKDARGIGSDRELGRPAISVAVDSSRDVASLGASKGGMVVEIMLAIGLVAYSDV